VNKTLRTNGLAGTNNCSSTNEWIDICRSSDKLNVENEQRRRDKTHMGVFYKYGLHFILHGESSIFFDWLCEMKICLTHQSATSLVEIKGQINRTVQNLRDKCLCLHIWPFIAASKVFKTAFFEHFY
jgi:hypothetical protein